MTYRMKAGIQALGWAALGLLWASTSACGAANQSVGSDHAARGNPGSNRVSFRLFGYSPTEIAHMRSALNFQGKVFLARYDPDNPQHIEWVDCPTPAVYRYVSGDQAVEELYIENTNDLQAHLPLSAANFSTYLSQGKRLRIRFATAGAFELVDDFAVSADGLCRNATHYVQTISVGAYAVSQVTDTGAGGDLDVGIGGGRGSHSDLSRRNVGMGNLDACRVPSSDAPPKNCQMPLEILLVDIGSHRAATPAPPRDGHPAPGPAVMPRPVAGTPPPARAHDGHTSCFVGIRRAGDAKADLTAITDRCGAPLGMVPVGDMIVDHLAEGQRMHSYAAELEAGQCYRIFAIGGPGVEDLDTGIRSGGGEWIAKDILDDNFPILNPDGPFCVREGGPHQLLVSVAKGAGTYAVQLFKATR